MGLATREPRGHEATGNTIPMTRRDVLALAALGAAASVPQPARAGAPQGQITYAVHISLPPTWLDPADTSAIITPFMLMYALHDAMAKGMPGQPQAPCLAESWSASEDGLTYDFVLRRGVKFHNGEPVTADDVKFSFDRYRGASYGLLKERVAAVETPDPLNVSFKLKQPWPDFLTFYAATGASWIVPRKYVEKVGDDGFRKAPVGAGPYKFVSFNAGVELVLEAFDQYWRKPPNVKRLVLKVIPDEATRLAALKTGEVDIAYSIRSELALQLRRIAGLKLEPVVVQGAFWLYFPEQWDPKSPWHDVRVRQAANLALDRDTINQALTLGASRVTGSIMPDIFEFYWAPPAPVYDPVKARQLLAEAGYPNGFDAGFYNCDSSYANIGEAALDNLRIAFWAAGKALQVIRDARLYRETHPTFEDYVEQRWDMSRPQAYRLIDAWPLAERLSPMGDKLNERQVRELLPLAGRHGQDAAVTVYRTIAETDGVQVTATLLHGAVSILPADHFDPAEAAEQIRAYLAGGSAGHQHSAPNPVETFTAEAAKLLRVLHRVADRGTLKAAAHEDPDTVRKVIADMRALLDEIEKGAL